MEPSKASRFIILEFLDAEINGLLYGLMNEFGRVEIHNKIHITVRGPYYGPIPAEEILRCSNILKYDPILIHDAGIFEDEHIGIVYLKVTSPNLKKIWWKPDFPIDKYGFNPHVTLYQGKDLTLVRLIFNFLKKEQINLLCHDFRLIQYTSKQNELFPNEAPKERHFLELKNKRIVKADILQRAANLMRNYYRAKNNASI
jgi:hypothetical protein